MTPSLNLISDPWLPALFAGESRPRDVSVRDAMLHAPEIQALGDPSPLVTIALYRLLLAIAHRVFGPATDDEWADLWEAGAFDVARLDAYFDQWRARFELFDADRPFYQVADLPEAYSTTIAKLGHQFSSGNNPLLFDHSQDAFPAAISPAAAARLLVAQQAFAVGGLITRLPGQPPSAESSHLLKAAVLLCTGENLHQTLVLNMVRLAGEEDQPFHFDPGKDAPAWEQEPNAPGERSVRGYFDLLTWQSRSIRLIPPSKDESGVSRVVIMNGSRFPAGFSGPGRETMVAYRRREKAAANQDPEPPVGFRLEQALWRDSAALLQVAEDHRLPRTLRHLGELKDNALLDQSTAINLSAFGLSSDRAKLFLWRHEEFPLPLAYLRNQDLVNALKRGIDSAASAGDRLRQATWRMAEDVLAPEGNADRGRVTALADSLAAERAYWPVLDVAFRRFMADLAEQYNVDGQFGAAAKKAWQAAVSEAASDAFELAARAIETSGRGFRAGAQGRARFRALLAGALKDLDPVESDMQPEEVPA